LIAFTPEVGQQIRDLRQNYAARDRPEAIRGLSAALETTRQKIEASPTAVLAGLEHRPECAYISINAQRSDPH
jgi:hypothetical protein